MIAAAGRPQRNHHGFGRASARPGGRSSFKVRGVEGWRGVACLLVVGYHVWQNMDVRGDGIGPTGGSTDVLVAVLSLDLVVDLFFVLSGLLLFLPFAHAALDDSRSVPARREFLWRRVVRLFPPYLVVVAIAWSSRNFGVETAQWVDLLEHLFLLQSFDSERIFYTVGPAWTLSIEWVFYLSLAVLGPLVVREVRRVPDRSVRARRLLLMFALVALVSVLYKLNVELVWQTPVTDWAWRFGPAAKADDFAIGMALAVVMVWMDGRHVPVVPSAVLALAGGYLLWTARADVTDSDSLLVMLRHPVAALGWALVLFAVMSCASERPARWVDNRLFVRLSIVAYTTYLVHEPVLLALMSAGLFRTDVDWILVNLVTVTAGTLVAAWVLHRVVEEPWVDLAALQARGGGRRDLYAHLAAPLTARAPRSPMPGDPSTLREDALVAAGHDSPVVLVSGERS
ncbi:acyltransferase [Nocardioides sp.]|uniref:acyltransferase family protein n=1 Tax=Nocardioides sp. TaxID=35761 RepID=UPI00286A65B0|nr:acyltransferase [Nocardioides sp.]